MIAPWTASWTGEESFYVAPCRFAGGHLALCQPDRRGTGKPLFAKPHSVRQRQAMACDLCDLCGIRLGPIKVSLSFERLADVGAVQVEPLSHPRCAVVAVANCPHLKRMNAAGMLQIREALKYRLAVAKLTAAAVREFAGVDYPDGAVYGHAKLLIDRAVTRDLDWLNRVGAP